MNFQKISKKIFVSKLFDDISIFWAKMAKLWVNFKICNFLTENHIIENHIIDTILESYTSSLKMVYRQEIFFSSNDAIIDFGILSLTMFS